MASDLVTMLVEATLATTAAIALVLVLRRPLRALFGAGPGYAIWALVPAALIAVLLPAARLPALPMLQAWTVAAPEAGVATVAEAGIDFGPWLLVAWLLGAVAAACLQWRQQQRFLHGLGALVPCGDGLLRSSRAAGLPAVIGWRACIVLPADFEQRYAPAQRALVICHEQMHRRRGDLHASAVVALLRALFWFNPLLHLAATRFRRDQELACDAAVLRRFPHARRDYGDALLKTQLADQPLPIGCHWFGAHPLKERLMMLKNPPISGARWATGSVLVLSLVCGGAWAAWAAQPAAPAAPVSLAANDIAVPAAPADLLDIAIVMSVDGKPVASPLLQQRLGQSFAVASGEGAARWAAEFQVNQAQDDLVQIAGSVLLGGKVVTRPVLNVALGRGAVIMAKSPDTNGEVRLEVTVTRASVDRTQRQMNSVGISGARPRYPTRAVIAGDGGMVMLRVLVGADGRVQRSEFVLESSSVPADSPLVVSAREASLKWTFNAANRSKVAGEDWRLVPVRFAPDGKPDDA